MPSLSKSQESFCIVSFSCTVRFSNCFRYTCWALRARVCGTGSHLRRCAVAWSRQTEPSSFSHGVDDRTLRRQSESHQTFGARSGRCRRRRWALSPCDTICTALSHSPSPVLALYFGLSISLECTHIINTTQALKIIFK